MYHALNDSLKADILDNVPAIIAFHDLEQNIVWANKAYREATGGYPESLKPQRCYFVWGLADRCPDCPVTKALATGESAEAELTPINQEGWPENQGSWLARAAPIRNERGEIVGAVETAFEITKRKKAEEEKLEESEERYRGIFEQAVDGIFLVDGTGNIKDCNPAACSMLGYQTEELLEKRFTDLNPADDLAEQPFYGDAVPGGKHVCIERELLRKDGTRRIMEESFVELHSGDILIMLRDITDRKQMEFDLVKERRLLQTIVDNIPVMITHYDPDSNMLYLNKQFEQTVGWSTEEVQHIDMLEKVYPDPDYRRQVWEYMQKATSEWKEFCVQSKQGDIIESEWSNILLENGTQVGIGIDIRERKRAETELQKNQAKLQTLIDQISEMLFLHDFEGNILDVNQRAVDQSGYSREELLSMRVPDLDPDYREREKDGSFWENTEWNQSCIFEARHQRKDGTIFPAEVTLSKITLGGVSYVMALALDISERKNSEALLIQAKEQAEVANRTKSEFLANMSHEIRTPLNGIKGMIELANRKAERPEQAREYLELAAQSTDHLISIINDVIDLSKIEAGHIQLNRQPFSLRDVLKATFYPLRIAAVNKELGFEVQVAPDVPDSLAGDANRFRQVLENIVGNAIKFTHSGEVSIALSLAEDLEDRVRILCTVTDTGIGIPSADVEAIFDNFGQSSPAIQAKYGGSGLGLALCKHYLEMMDGHIWCSSREGEGSTFSFTLVLETDHAVGADSPSQEADSSQPAPGTRALKILVADDSRMNQMFTAEILRDMGHEVVIAEDGQKALEALARDRFDLVLMDIRMPNLDGQEALRAIREERVPGVNPRLPVIALTAYALREDQERLLGQGFDAYLSKPIDIQSLEKTISNMAREKGSEDSSFPGK